MIVISEVFLNESLCSDVRINISHERERYRRWMYEIDWQMVVDISQVISSAAVAVAFGYTVKTFLWARRSDQIELAEGVCNENYTDDR